MRRMLLAVVLLLSSPVDAIADGFASIADARGHAEEAMELFAAGQLADGFKMFKPYWPIPESEIDGMISASESQWPTMMQRFGQSLDVEFVSERQVGQSLVQLVFLQKFERTALRWNFLLYRPSDVWYINSVSFDDQVTELFEPGN